MREIIINQNEAGQRLDKFLTKYLNKSSKSNIYKLLRKKTITINDKKKEASYITALNDNIKIWISEETLATLRDENKSTVTKKYDMPEILHDGSLAIIINKPAGMLSQKSSATDISANEIICSYLAEHSSSDETRAFTPSICNRLDRNTSGILIAGKTLLGLQLLTELIRTRQIKKEYLAIVCGRVDSSMLLKSYLKKDDSNKVHIYDECIEGSSYIETSYKPVGYVGDDTLLSIDLITGKTHQIRAHLAHIAHPLLGDMKYGNRKYNEKHKARHQMLHAYRIGFPEMEELGELSDADIYAPLPDEFKKRLKGITWLEGQREVYEALL